MGNFAERVLIATLGNFLFVALLAGMYYFDLIEFRWLKGMLCHA